MSNAFTQTSSNIWQSTTSNIWHGLVEIIDQIIYQYASRRYYFTLTGSPDGLEDIIIPIKTLQARRRNGTPSYLAVTFPNISLYNEVVARQNGEMVVEISYWFNNQDNFKTEIARAELEEIRWDRGGNSATISLSGHSDITTIPKRIITSGKSTYRRISGGKLTHRMAEPEIFLNPGDTVVIGDDEFVVGLMTYAIGTNNDMTFMEVGEA